MTVPAGRINKLFGTEGGVMLSLYPAFPDDFTTDTPLMVTIDALEVPLWCEHFERRGQSGATATFADFDTERRAQELLGLEFRIEPEEKGEDDEFYLEDLIGFAVEAEETGTPEKFKGTVSDYYDSDVNPLFELDRRTAGAGPRRRGIHRTHRLRGPHDAPRAARRTSDTGIGWHG